MSFAAFTASGVLTFVRNRVLNVVSMAFCAAMPDALEQLRNGLLGILQSAAEQENAHEADE